MNSLYTVFAICCLAASAKAKPGVGHTHLTGIPDIQSFHDIRYPKYHLIDLGEHSKGHIPATEIHETKHITVKVPEPYPVKIPVPHPYPVPVHKPYPVVETKYVKVPHAVPYEIVKQVPVPVEVPKPYPVPVSSHEGSSGGGGGGWHGAGLDLSHAGSGQISQSYSVEESNNDVGNLAGDGGQVSSYEDQGQDNASQGHYDVDENQQQQQIGGQGGWQGLDLGHQ